MTTTTLRDSQLMTATADQLDGDSLTFAGNSATPSEIPAATFIGSNTLSRIDAGGQAALPGYGAISLMPGASLTTAGLTIDAANLSVNERPNASVTFNGTSQILSGSTLTASGYGGAGNYTVNGTMDIDGSSTVNMDYVALNGTGTLHLSGEDALLRVGAVSASETVVLDGGMLSLTDGMNFLGTITSSAPAASRMGPIACIAVYNALDAVQETFDRTTGLLNLYNAQGATVANLKFAGAGDLYAAPTSGLPTNYIAITSHPSDGALPVTFTS